MPVSSDIIAQRRKQWFATCTELGLNDEFQQAIAAGIIPENRRDKYKPDGSVSRKLLFTDHYWSDALRQLNAIRTGSYKPLTAHQGLIRKCFKLAFLLKWNEHGYDDLRSRLQKFAARQSGFSSSVTLDALNTDQLNKVIEGLKSMLERSQKSKTDTRQKSNSVPF